MAVSLLATSAYAQVQNPLDTLGSLSSDGGLYSNRIPSFALPQSFLEVCFKNGQILTDQNPGGGSPQGGNCLPGDTGWAMEQAERPAETWADARATCLAVGMRLPELFEFKYGCDNRVAFGLSDMTGNNEWVSNSTLAMDTDGINRIVVPTLGEGDTCTNGGFAAVVRDDEIERSLPFRCVR